ncbi:hypothetical protein AWM75_01580 [Aerococcus urinaehominis]|uniref:Permease n=1 Tax=Aerococcus urinaehominis TaxID=128944 RepID=A0A0X8FME9_9LACT|nr:hypothetical protein AWM75_01580 [Aerococcus urinaehominis]
MAQYEKSGNSFENSWFYRILIDNRYTVTLYVLIVISILIWLVRRLEFAYQPVFDILGIIILPIAIAAVFYYLTVPLVNKLEKKGISRLVGAIIVLVLIALALVGLISLIPGLIGQGEEFLADWQSIWHQYEKVVESAIGAAWYSELQVLIDDFLNDAAKFDSINWSDLANQTIERLGSILGTVTKVGVALVAAPIILFYMFKDGRQWTENAKQLIPVRIRPQTIRLFSEMNVQISQYIRGQILVALSVAVMFVIGYAVIGLRYGTVIGIAAGFLNVIPYLGSFLGMIPAIIVAIVMGPAMLVKVLLVFAIEQTIEARIISPQILGSNLEIHPVTIMLLLIIGGSYFGVVGVIIIIPVYAVLKVIVQHFFTWYQQVSGLYEEDHNHEINR